MQKFDNMTFSLLDSVIKGCEQNNKRVSVEFEHTAYFIDHVTVNAVMLVKQNATHIYYPGDDISPTADDEDYVEIMFDNPIISAVTTAIFFKEKFVDVTLREICLPSYFLQFRKNALAFRVCQSHEHYSDETGREFVWKEDHLEFLEK